MVRIVNYQKRTTEGGKEFFVLEIQSGITMVKSKETGKFYATAVKATLSSTFDELTCKALIGTELPGIIEKVECEPYDYVVKETGEIIKLSHRFEYVDENTVAQKAEQSKLLEDELRIAHLANTFSGTNGQLVH